MGSPSDPLLKNAQEGDGPSLDVLLFPNPSTDVASILVNSAESRTLVNIRIRDVMGKEISRFIISPGKAHLLTEKLKAGIYFIEAIQNKRKTIQKLVRIN